MFIDTRLCFPQYHAINTIRSTSSSRLEDLPSGVGCINKEWIGCFLIDFRVFSINADQWMAVVQDEVIWRKTAEQGAERFMAK